MVEVTVDGRNTGLGLVGTGTASIIAMLDRTSSISGWREGRRCVGSAVLILKVSMLGWLFSWAALAGSFSFC